MIEYKYETMHVDQYHDGTYGLRCECGSPEFGVRMDVWWIADCGGIVNLTDHSGESQWCTKEEAVAAMYALLANLSGAPEGWNDHD